MSNGNSLAVGEFRDNHLAELEDKINEQNDKFAEISRVGAVVTSLLDLERILPVVMESALSIVKGEVGQMVIFNGAGQGRSDISWGLSANTVAAIITDERENIWDYIKRTGNSVNIDFSSLPCPWVSQIADTNLCSLLAVPLKAQDHIIGAAAVANKIDAPAFDDDDLFALEMLGSFAAVAVQNSVFHLQALDRQKLEAEIEMARQVQVTLLPKKIDGSDRLAIQTHNRMAHQVGGDFYDFIKLSPERYLIVIADVSSKGFPAALLMTSTRGLVRAFANEQANLADIVYKVNMQLCRDAHGLKGMFVTLILVCFDFASATISSVNAGHPPGLLGYPDGTIRELKKGGPFVGQFEDVRYTQEDLPLLPGSRMFLFTDGAFECVDDEGCMLGLARLREFFAKNRAQSAHNYMDQMLKMLEQYTADPDRIDDTTFLLADVR